MKQKLLKYVVIALAFLPLGSFWNVAFSGEFVSLTPCRVVDTRQMVQGPILAGSTRHFKISGYDHQSQGGERCQGIPESEIGKLPTEQKLAAVINVVSVGASGNGNLVVYKSTHKIVTRGLFSGHTQFSLYGDSPVPLASLLNFRAGDVTANSTVAGICEDDPAEVVTADCYLGYCSRCNGDISIHSSFSSTHVIVDIMGYYK